MRGSTDHRIGVRSLRTLSSTRRDRNGSIDQSRARPARHHRLRARGHGRDRAGIIERDAAPTSFHRSSGPRRSRPRWRWSSGRRTRKDAPARPPRLNDENTTLSCSAPSRTGRRGCPRSPARRRRRDRQCGPQPVQQVGPAVHGGGTVADRQRTPWGGRRRRSSACRRRAPVSVTRFCQARAMAPGRRRGPR